MTEPNQSEGEDLKPSAEGQDAVDDKLQEETPTSEQKPAEEEVEDTSDVDEEEREALANAKNPTRTKAYIDKLKAQLKAKETQPVYQEDYGTSVFDSLKPKPAMPQQGQAPIAPQVPSAADFPFLRPNEAENILQNYIQVDPQTGEQTVDVNGLQYALFQANESARRANQRVQNVEGQLKATNENIARFEETQQAKELHREFPELDPLNKESFDPKLFKYVSRSLLENRARGLSISPNDVAREVKSELYGSTSVDKATIEEEIDTKLKKKQEARNQGPLETGRGVNRDITPANIGDLRKRTRLNDGEALTERLKAIGVIKE